MAGPSVVVRVLGDTKGLGSSFQAAGKAAETASSRARGAFGSVLGTLNRTGILGPFGESLATINEAIDRTAEHAKGIGTAMLGVGGALTGVGVGLAALGSKDQAAHQQLQAAVEATGKSYEDYAGRVEEAIKHQEKFGHTANQTQDALRTLTQATGDPAKALQLLGTASDLAAAKHEDLNTAAGQLGKTYNGATRLLKEFGVTAAPKAAAATKALDTATRQAATADDRAAAAKQHLADIHALLAGKSKLTAAEQIRLRDAEQKAAATAAAARAAHQKLADAQDTAKKAATGQADTMTALSQKLSGQASASADTFTGRLDAMKAKVEDTAASLGQKYGGAITAFGTVMGATGGIIKAFQGTTEAATAATEAQTVATETQSVALDAEAASAGAADAASLPLILTIGLIVLAVAALIAIAYVLYRNWSTIWGFIKRVVEDAFNWIKTNWPLLLAILTGPIGLAVLLIVKNWDKIKDAAKAVFDFIKRIWNDIVGFFEKLPGRIARLAVAMFKGFANGFIGAINAIIHAWNNLKFTIGGFKLPFPPHTKFPSLTLDTPNIPDIPHLAQGGLITQSGIVYAHAGEVISPAPGAGGPVMAINNATFSSEVDVELLTRKIEFALNAGIAF